MAESKLVLIDGNSYLHRAYHALPRLTDARGNVVNAVFGFLKMLRKVLDDEQPSHIMVAFDHKRPTFRHKDYKEYKAHREKMDPELAQQIPMLHEVLDALNISYMDFEGFEADDILATVARTADEKDMKVTIVTGDKDALQLIRDNVSVLRGTNGKRYDADGVVEKLGVRPAQIVDYLALIGDSSDNLPGVRGVGPVTARKLLVEYGDLDTVYRNIENIDDGVRKKLEKGREDAYMTRRLVKLVENMDIGYSVDDYLWKGPDADRLREVFGEFNFNSILGDWMETDTLKGDIQVTVIADIAVFREKLHEIESSGIIIYEPVFTDDGELSGLGISDGGDIFVYVPFRHRYLGVEDQLDPGPVMESLKDVIGCAASSYDIKRFYKFLKKQGLDLENPVFDVITADYILSSQTGKSSLRDICSRYLAWVPPDYSDQEQENEIKITAEKVKSRLAAVSGLMGKMNSDMKKNGMDKLYCRVELPLLEILGEMELTGIGLDIDELEKVKKEFRSRLVKIEETIFELAGEKFNINSSKQLAQILFNKLKLDPVKKTKSGYSTAEEVLVKLAEEHPLPEKVIGYRKLQKLLSTYVEPLPEMADDNRRLHTTFNITGTATGRLSSTEPNLQNIPVRSEEGCLIRKAFIASRGRMFLSADYSQIDLRVLAHISQDAGLIESFRQGEDIHRRTAALVYGTDEASVTEEMRKRAKAVNFGIVYGMSSHGLSRRVDMDVKEAGDFIKKYFEGYPGIEKYMEDVVAEAREKLYVSTILNRRRYLPEINSSNFRRKSLYERMAINTPIQGSSADIIKKAMIDLNEEFDFNGGEIKLLLQIHDELLFEMPREKIENCGPIIKDIMESAVNIDVPLVVDLKKGSNWRDLESC